MPLSREVKKYTYADYLKFPSDERWEIINGIPNMQSASTWQHQAVSIQLASQFNDYFKVNHVEYLLPPLIFVFLNSMKAMKKFQISLHNPILL